MGTEKLKGIPIHDEKEIGDFFRLFENPEFLYRLLARGDSM